MNETVLRDKILLSAEVSSLTKDFTPEVNRFVNLLLAMLRLEPIAPTVDRSNGIYIKSIAELPVIEVEQWTG